MAGESNEGSLTITTLTDDVIDALHGYTRDMSQVTELSNSMTNLDVTFKVSEAQQVNRGLAEIDDELVFVKSIDSNGNGTIFSWGRGQQGSSAAAHSSGAKVTMAPLYPRQRVRDSLFATLREMHPDIAPIVDEFIDVNIVRTNYPMPSDCYHILQVQWNPPGPSGMWKNVKRWRQNKTGAGVELELLGPAWPGPDRARVMYMKNLPTTLTANQDLAAYGYPQDIHGCLVLGATARLLSNTEASRLQVQSVQSNARAETTPAGSISNLAKFVYSLYQTRLQELRFWYAERYPLGPKQNW